MQAGAGNTFRSFSHFRQMLGAALRGPSIIKAVATVDSRMREKVLLTVSQANNCQA